MALLASVADRGLSSSMVTAVHQHALEKVVDSGDKSYLPCVDRLLLSLLFHCSKDENHTRAMKDVEAALACTFMELRQLQSHRITSEQISTALRSYFPRFPPLRV